MLRWSPPGRRVGVTALVVAFASMGCGRLGFAPGAADEGDGGPGEDASAPETRAPLVIDVRPVTGLTLGAGPVLDVALARGGDGLLTFALTRAGHIAMEGAKLDAAGVVDRDPPTALSTGGPYETVSLAWNGSVFLCEMSRPDLPFLKVVPAALGNFARADELVGRAADPAYVFAGGTWSAVTWVDGVINRNPIDAAGFAQEAIKLDFDTRRFRRVTTAAAGSTPLIGLEGVDGACARPADSGATQLEPIVPSDCAGLLLVGGPTAADAVYRTSTKIEARTVSPGVAAGPPRALGASAGSAPIVAARAGGRLFVVDATAAGLTVFDEGPGAPRATAIPALPAGPPDAYTALGESDALHVLAAYGSDLYLISIGT